MITPSFHPFAVSAPKFGQKHSTEALKQRFTQDQTQLRQLASELENTIPALMGDAVMAVGAGLMGAWDNPQQSDPLGIMILTRADKPDAKEKTLAALRQQPAIRPVTDDLYQYKGALVKVIELPPPDAH